MAGERNGGRAPWAFLAAMAILALAGAGMGAGAALVWGRDVEEWASGGFLAGILVMLAWSVYALLALGVMWVLGISPEQAERVDETGRPGHAPGTRGRHAAPMAPISWRSRGDRLIPGGLVAFFLIMVPFGAAGWASTQHELRVIPESNRLITTGLVVEFREPAFYDKGPGSIIVSFDAGAPVTAEVSGNIGDHSLDVGDSVPIEYDPASPERARVTWTREQLREDLAFAKGWVAVTGTLAGVSALGWLAGGRRGRQTS